MKTALGECLEDGFPFTPRIVRTMPNLPALVCMGATPFCMNDASKRSREDKEVVEILMNSIGTCYECKEELIDPFTGVSGSGPAYVFMFIEAMADQGVKQGIPRDIAIKFAAQTVMGASKMVLETGEDPSRLKENVCSPGGTTIEAVKSLEETGFRDSVM